MKFKHTYIGLIAAIATMVVSCRPEIDHSSPSSGDADFSKYIAIGNSLTAGFADGGLYLEGQQNAYPLLIAQQMKQVGGGEFASPFFSEAQANGSGYIRLSGFDDNGRPVTARVTDKLAYRNQQGTLLAKFTDEVNNLGVPGMSVLFSQQEIMSSTSGNMYLERLVADADAGNLSYLEFTQNRDHTFFTFWLGNIDALNWATSGGAPGNDPTKQLTPANQFSALYTAFINSLTSNGAKGAVATVPDVSAIPFFNTVKASALLAGAKAINPDAQAIFIQTSAGTRAADDADLITLNLTADGKFGQPNLLGIPYGLHPANPIESKYVLDKDETTTVQNRIVEFNNVIKQVAESKGLALVDAYAVLNRIKTAQVYDGIAVSSAFVTGNAFSLDGVHLTPLGNAIIANEFIAAINAKYNSNIPTVSVGNFRGIKFPQKVE